MPITLDDGRTFDFDRDSMELMPRSISRFELLPTLDALGRLPWKDADNVYHPLTKPELIAIHEELQTKQAVRAARLQVIAEQLAANPPFVKDLDDLATWGLA